MEDALRLECLKLAATHDRTGDPIIVLLAAASWANFVIDGADGKTFKEGLASDEEEKGQGRP